MAFAAAGLHRGFSWHELAVPIGCAVAVPTACVTMVALLRPKRARLIGLVIALSAVLWLVVGAATVFGADLRAAPPWDVVPDVLRGTLDGWAALLRVTLPAAGQPTLLALPFALVWAAATASAASALWSRKPTVPAIPALVLFALTLAITVPGQGSDTVPAAGLAADILILTVVRARRDRGTRATTVRQLTVATAYAAVLATVACLAASTLLAHVGRAPVDPRRLVRTRFAADTQYDLLQQLAAWQSGPDTALFTVRAEDPGYLRLAVLDRFDGDTWTSDARFTLAGGAVPPAAGASTPAGPATQQFTVQGLTGYYLPEANRPTRLRGTDLAVDLGSGTVASTAGLSPGLSYTVTSAAAAPDGSKLGHTPSADTIAAAAAEPVPLAQVPAPIRALAASVAARFPQSPYTELRYLQVYLPARYGIDPDAQGGTAAADLDSVLSGREPADAGQLSAIFALAARSLGLPARLVVGFQPVPVHAAGSSEVTANDAAAWPEVGFAGVGWVPFHLTGHLVHAAARPPIVTVTSTPSVHPTPPTPSATVSVPILQPPATSVTRGTSWIFAAGLPAAGGCALYLLIVLGMPGLLRRDRRTRGSDERKVEQAWFDVLDTLRLSGRKVPASATTRHIVRLAYSAGVRTGSRRVRTDPKEQRLLLSGLLWLGYRADAIAFDKAEVVCSPRHARIAWLAAEQTRRAVHRAAPLPRRAAMALGPGQVIRLLRLSISLPGHRPARSGRDRG